MSLTPDLCHSDSFRLSLLLSPHTQKLTHWLTCPTFPHDLPSDWLGALANSQSEGIYWAGWPVKCRVQDCVRVCVEVG